MLLSVWDFALNPAVYMILLSTLHVVVRGADLNASFQEELGKGGVACYGASLLFMPS